MRSTHPAPPSQAQHTGSTPTTTPRATHAIVPPRKRWQLKLAQENLPPGWRWAYSTQESTRCDPQARYGRLCRPWPVLPLVINRTINPTHLPHRFAHPLFRAFRGERAFRLLACTTVAIAPLGEDEQEALVEASRNSVGGSGALRASL